VHTCDVRDHLLSGRGCFHRSPSSSARIAVRLAVAGWTGEVGDDNLGKHALPEEWDDRRYQKARLYMASAVRIITWLVWFFWDPRG
jgi:hypothetical protein